MKVLKRIFINWWVLSLLVLALFVVIFVVLLPFVVFAFEPWSVRLVFAALFVSVWTALAVWRVRSAKKASDRLERSIEIVAPEGESAILAARMRTALASLRSLGAKGRDYLYSRPWYVIIGAPGVGKTTALENSGLRFLADGGAPSSVGGTRNINFIFADEAVLIDTAGRYTSQDSDSERDRSAWREFLQLLRKNRPLQPINGVIVALGLDDLAEADLAAIDRHARIVRDRLRELQTTLALHIPVYVVFTKADLIAGFTEFYDDLDVEGRRAVLGATLPWKADKRPGAAAWTIAFDELSEAVQGRMAKRLQDELDSRRRSLILGFPVQISALRARVVSFLSLAFPEDDPLSTVSPRGFYFTSGTQQGTPFDRVLGRLAALYDTPQARGAHGRAYFINRLLKEVMIGEAGLVRRTSQLRSRERALLAAGLAAIGIFSVAALAFWTMSYLRNQDFESRLAVAAQAAALQRQQDGLSLISVGDAEFPTIVPLLGKLRALPRGYDEARNSGPPLLMTFGLYQSGLSHNAVNAYVETLKRTLLPRLLWRLEGLLSDRNSQRIYDPLKVYLMLGGLAPSGKFDAKTITNWAESDWNEEYAGDAKLRAYLEQHLAGMLEDGDLWSVWHRKDGLADVNQQLIDNARQVIANTTIADRAYQILKENEAGAGPDWSAAAHLNDNELDVFADRSTIKALKIPYLFTSDGYRAYETGLGEIDEQIENDSWVYGPHVGTLTYSEMRSLQADIAIRYAGEYIREWQGVVDAVRLANYISDPTVMATATGADSPILWLFNQVSSNTQLVNAARTTATAKLLGLGSLMSKVNSYKKAFGVNTTSAAAIIDARFQPFRKALKAGKLQAFLQAQNDLATATEAVKTAQQSGTPDQATQAQLVQARTKMNMAAAAVPGVLQGTTGAAAKSASKQSEDTQAEAAKADVVKDYAPLATACENAVNNHYPFEQTESAANRNDLDEVFGETGKLHQFITGELSTYLDTSRSSWRWNESDPIARSFDHESALELQRAERIHTLLAREVGLNVSASDWGGKVEKAELVVGGIPYEFQKKGVTAPRKFEWMLMGMQPGAILILKDKDDNALKTIQGDDTIWGLYRLFEPENAKLEGVTASDFDATFPADGDDFVKFHVTLTAAFNPFIHQNWLFRCPRRL